jgi:hypothetical protein
MFKKFNLKKEGKLIQNPVFSDLDSKSEIIKTYGPEGKDDLFKGQN